MGKNWQIAFGILFEITVRFKQILKQHTKKESLTYGRVFGIIGFYDEANVDLLVKYVCNLALFLASIVEIKIFTKSARLR